MRSTTPVARNATELVNLVENGLGYDPNEAAQEKTIPVWRVKALEAGKLNAAMKRRKNCTLETLTISYDYCRAEKIAALSPYVLVTMLDQAIIWNRTTEQPRVVGDLGDEVLDAMRVEIERGDAETPIWVGRLQRAQGAGRRTALDEWEAAGRGRG